MFKKWSLSLVALFICSESVAGAQELRVLTLHAWLVQAKVSSYGGTIKYNVSSNNDLRIQLLPQIAAKSGADVIAFEEIWNTDQRATLKNVIKNIKDASGNTVYPYLTYLSQPNPPGYGGGKIEKFSFWENSALWAIANLDKTRREMGNGLYIASKYPFSCKTQQLRFTQHTRLDETVTMKGAIKACINVPGLGNIDIYTSHLGAVTYDTSKLQYDPEELEAHQSQLNELTAWIQKTRTQNPLIGAFVLNNHYYDIQNGEYLTSKISGQYESVISTNQGALGLIDTFVATHPDALENPSYTHNPQDPNSAAKQYGHFVYDPPEVDDYIFMSPNDVIEPVDSRLTFNVKYDRQKLKDLGIDADKIVPKGQEVPTQLVTHFGVLTTFRAKVSH